MSEIDWTRLSELEGQLEAVINNDDDENNCKAFISILKNTCAFIRDAEAEGATNLDIAIHRVDRLIDKALNFAYGDSEWFDFVPSAYAIQKILSFFGAPKGENTFSNMTSLKPWNETTNPHPKSTTMARFRDLSCPLSVTTTTPMAAAIYEARCEISAESTNSPIQMAISSGGICMSLLSAGGYKNRDPFLSYFILDNDNNDFHKGRHFKIGLSEVAHHSVIDESRKLIFVADSYRIKSYKWDAVDDNRNALAVHTMKSGKFKGPLALFSNGRLLRAGKGAAGVWNIDNLETHGPSGRNRIGKRFNAEDSWRDEPDDIEISSGSAMHQQIQFADNAIEPASWHTHPSAVGTMLCASDPGTVPHRYWCCALDLEHGGKTSIRFLGHGGEVNSFSTSQTDPTAFVTACSDGYVRLYDVRHPLPVLTMDIEKQSSPCNVALLVHPNGIPTIFAGSDRAEHIELWDVRARACVYELATGNNAVVDLVWDSERNNLYAATQCNYVDRLGYHHDYRLVKPSKWQKAAEDGEESMDVDQDNMDELGDNDDDDDDDDGDGYDDRRWPKQAHHVEGYFGHLYDAGDHTLFRYSFKQDADNKILPVYCL